MAAATKPRVRGKSASPAVKAARAAMRGKVGGTVEQFPVAIVLAWAAPDAERLAAANWVRGEEINADEWHEEGPLWLGHAIHAAFLAGIAWAHTHEEKVDEAPGG